MEIKAGRIEERDVTATRGLLVLFGARTVELHLAVNGYATSAKTRLFNLPRTDENIRFCRTLAAAPQLFAAGKEVMSLLETHGQSIVPHLLDTDMNAGQRLRDAIALVETV